MANQVSMQLKYHLTPISSFQMILSFLSINSMQHLYKLRKTLKLNQVTPMHNDLGNEPETSRSVGATTDRSVRQRRNCNRAPCTDPPRKFRHRLSQLAFTRTRLQPIPSQVSPFVEEAGKKFLISIVFIMRVLT